MKKNHDAGIPTPELKVENAPDFKTIYANWVQGSFSAFDISLLLGEGFSASPFETVNHLNLRARLVFSPLEAKLVVRILRSMILSHEKQFGEIRIPDGGNLVSTTGDAVVVEDDSEGD